jgi:hypothetical protein
MSEGVAIFAALSALIRLIWVARPVESSPTPAANNLSPSRRTLTGVPAGKTVSMCAELTTILPPLPVPLVQAQHIALGVDLDIAQAELAKHVGIDRGAGRLLERR